MFLRALAAFLALPGMVAGAIPVIIITFDPWRTGGVQIGYLALGLGLLILLWCVRDFYVSGKGTLAPWSPPKKLVVVGLYRFLRNPMYIGVLLILLGWCTISGSPISVVYLLVVSTMFHRRVTRNEEPWLQRKFGEDWAAYSAGVHRWLPRSRPWHPNETST